MRKREPIITPGYMEEDYLSQELRDNMIIRGRNDGLGYFRVKIFPLIFLIIMVTCLGCPNPDAEEYLRDLKSPNVVIKREAIYKIGKFQIREAVPELISLLNGDSGELSADIIAALGRIGDNAAVKPLIAKLNNDNAFIRERAIEALGKIGDRKAVPALTSILEQRDSKSEGEILTVIWALGNIGDRSAEPILNSLLKDNNKYIRYNVEQALKKIRAEKGEIKQTDSTREPGKTSFHNIYKFLQSQIELAKETVSRLQKSVNQLYTRMINALKKSYNVSLSGITPIRKGGALNPALCKNYLPTSYGQSKKPPSSGSEKTVQQKQTIQAKADPQRKAPDDPKPTVSPSAPHQTQVISHALLGPNPVKTIVTPIENKIYNLNELPLSIKQTLPNFLISVVVYSDDASSRMVKINDEMMQEGEYLTDGLKLEKITPDGTIFRYQNYLFRVAPR